MGSRQMDTGGLDCFGACWKVMDTVSLTLRKPLSNHKLWRDGQISRGYYAFMREMQFVESGHLTDHECACVQPPPVSKKSSEHLVDFLKISNQYPALPMSSRPETAFNLAKR